MVIVQTGFSTNLARLLNTPGDRYSPLGGRELIARKVRVLQVMAGRFDASDSTSRDFLEFNVKNIAVVLASLCGFALISEHLNMIAGIVFLVFCSTYAGTSYSVVRNLKISAGLIVIAFALQKLLGLNLPLY